MTALAITTGPADDRPADTGRWVGEALRTLSAGADDFVILSLPADTPPGEVGRIVAAYPTITLVFAGPLAVSAVAPHQMRDAGWARVPLTAGPMP